MYTLFLGFTTALALTYAIIPVIIRVTRERRLFDRPNERSAHVEPTPSLGGIGIFAGTVCGIVLWTPVGSFGLLQYILAAFVMIFLLGILDDLLPISPSKKFLGQIFVAIILAYKAGITITSFYGVFGIYELSPVESFALSILTIVGIINAFNLIDGINGLAGSIGLLSCLLFGAWFMVVGVTSLAVVAFALAGAIVGFLRFNFTPAKIFMGDTGSLLVGTVCAILGISFIEYNYKLPSDTPYVFGAAPGIALAILFLPIYDTFSVFLRRIMKGRSPFSADKTHVHHQMLGLGLSHTGATLTLISINMVCIFVAVSLNRQGLAIVLLAEIAFAFLLTLALVMLARNRRQQAKAG